MTLPEHVRIREVGPRDGFQNEPEVIATADKVPPRLRRLNELLVGSEEHPKWEVVELRDFGLPVTIEPPPANALVPAFEWRDVPDTVRAVGSLALLAWERRRALREFFRPS